MDKQRIRSLQIKWKIQSVLLSLLIGLSAGLLGAALFQRRVEDAGWIGGLLFEAVFLIALFFFPAWRMTMTDTTRFLDQQVPELEESSELLLLPPDDLGTLEKWQAARTAAKLRSIPAPRPFQKKIILSTCLLAASYVVFCLTWQGSYAVYPGNKVRGTGALIHTEKNPVPGIRSIHIRIIPPAYTGKPVREQEEPDLRLEEGSQLNWRLETTLPSSGVQFLFNDTLWQSLQPETKEHTFWNLNASSLHSGFYQVLVDDRSSGLYKIEVVRDQPPRILIMTPKPYTVVEFGEPDQIPLAVNVQDDYGIKDAVVIATLASGSGETVKFSEKIISFGRSFPERPVSCNLSVSLDLPALGLRPGDELYYYIRALDNHEQESRSDMYIISLTDTAQLMSLEGMKMSMDVKPQYFRSERQIILETEQLLREKDTIPATQFNNRSNDLGIDQHLLRLRYGKYLGEEPEEGPKSDHTENAGTLSDFGNAKSILDAFTDKHDNAEDATYFEPAIREQLKATLTEMWNAELRLRTYKPKEALPFAYKALRLLKDLQQKSRAYVAKTGVRVTPLDTAKRLSGKLESIGQPVYRSMKEVVPDPETILRISLGILDQLHSGQLSKPSLDVLQRAAGQIGRTAAAHPGEYLPAYKAIKRIMEKEIDSDSGPKEQKEQKGPDPLQDKIDIVLVQLAIRKMLPEAEASPSPIKISDGGKLSQLYFRNLNEPLRKQ